MASFRLPTNPCLNKGASLSDAKVKTPDKNRMKISEALRRSIDQISIGRATDELRLLRLFNTKSCALFASVETVSNPATCSERAVYRKRQIVSSV